MKHRRFVLLAFALMGFLPGLALANLNFAGLPPLQLQGSSKSPDSHYLILTFQYSYPLDRKPGDLTFQWQPWHCTPGTKDIAPANVPYDESPFPGFGCTSWVRNPKPLGVASSTGSTLVDVIGKPGIWYVRARLSSRQDGVGPWGSWHRTEVWTPKKGVLVRPQISWPPEGAEIIGKDLTLTIALGSHLQGSELHWQYQLDWQRAKVITRFNDTYVRNHTPPGKIPEGEFPGLRRPWNNPMRPTIVDGLNPSMFAHLDFDTARPQSHKFGYRYWVRAREHDLPTDSYSRWSAWVSFTVQELTTTKLTARVLHVKNSPAAKPPTILTPSQKQLFVNHGVNIEVSPALKHTDYSRWEYVFEWKRGAYYTAANNAYVKQKWGQTHHGNFGSYFPRAVGLVDTIQPWLSLARLRTIRESFGTTGGFYVIGSKRPTMSTHLNFSSLRSKRMDSSYLYQFHVREHSRDSNVYGSWSPWRSFIVQEPYRISMRPFMGSLGQKQGKQQFGQQQSRHFAPLSPVRRLNRPVRRLPRSKQAAVGLRHAAQQRGVQKKLTPVAPVQRMKLAPPRMKLTPKKTASPRHATQQHGVQMKLAPVAPVRRLSLPAMQLRAR